MSCPNSSAPKCCQPPKKPSSGGSEAKQLTCSSLPNTLTFTCPTDECQANTAKPFCPEKKVDCTALGGGSGGSGGGSGGCGTTGSPAPVVDTCGEGGGSGPAPAPPSGGGCSANTSCEVSPLSMDGGCSK